MATTVQRYTISEYLDQAMALGPSTHKVEYASTFTGGLTTDQCINLARNGDPSLTQRTQEAIDKLEIGAAVDRVFKSQPGFVGCVNVGAYLAGSPTCMRQRQRVESVTRHVNIYVCLTMSAGVGIEQGIQRGTAIIGLLDSIQKAGLGMTVHMISEMGVGSSWMSASSKENGDIYHVITLDTPVDLSVMSFALGHPGFLRGVTFPMGDRDDFNGDWPRSYRRYNGETRSQEYLDFVRRTLDMAPGDIYIPAMHISDPILKEPARWVQETLKQITET